MYSKEEAARIRREFWTTFGKYMQPVPSFDGSEVNWINYKTGVKNIRIKTDADTSHAMVAIELLHKSEEERAEVRKKFSLLEDDLAALPGEWHWKKVGDHFLYVSRLDNVNLHRKETWPQIISFLKTGLTAIDEFWSNNKEFFSVHNA